MQDLHALPKLADSLSYLYVEHCIVEKNQQSIEFFDQAGATLVPAASLSVLMLGPGTRITHAAVRVLARSGCSLVWVGEDSTRCYANGGGETRRAYHLLHQARLASDPALRLAVCKRMYAYRFDDPLDDDLDIQQLRGMEGARVRTAYAQASLYYGVDWHGRRYKRGSWGDTDPINRALSAANALLNGLCHAAIVSAGYSPGLGFIHTGKQLSFVYDIADLYKAELTIPVAFETTARSTRKLEPRVRAACRAAFKKAKLLKRILPDIQALLEVPDDVLAAGAEVDADPAYPEPLWSPPRAEPPTEAGTPPEEAGTPPTEAQRPPEEAQRPVEDLATAPPAVLAPVSASRAGTAPGPAPELTAPTRLPAPPPQAVTPHPPHEARSTTTAEDEGLLRRYRRAKAGLDADWIVRHLEPETWLVITRPDSPGYTIQRVEGRLVCECPDFTQRELGACKHTFAVELTGGAAHVPPEEEEAP